MGRRTPAAGTWLCSVDALPLTSLYPAVWVSDIDATDEDAGIHCGRISEDLLSRADRTVRALRGLLP